MAARDRWWRLALLTTFGSVVGALVGYPLGYFLIETLTPLLHDVGYWDAYQHAQDWFAKYGFWALLVHVINQPQPNQRQVRVYGVEHFRLLRDYPSQPSGADDLGIVIQLLLEPGDHSFDQASITKYQT